MENVSTCPPLSTDNVVSSRIPIFDLEICELIFSYTQPIQSRQGPPQAHLPTGAVQLKLLMCWFASSHYLFLWFRQLQHKEQWGISACVNLTLFSNTTLPLWSDFPLSCFSSVIAVCNKKKKKLPLRATKQSYCSSFDVFTVTWSVVSIWLSIKGGSPSKSRDRNPSMSD